jgi:hypothetical protein
MAATTSNLPAQTASTTQTVSNVDRGPKPIFGWALEPTPAIPNDAQAGQAKFTVSISQSAATFDGQIVTLTAVTNVGNAPRRVIPLGSYSSKVAGGGGSFTFYLNNDETSQLVRDQGGAVEIQAYLAEGSTGGVTLRGFLAPGQTGASITWSPAGDTPPPSGGGAGTLPPGAVTGWLGSDYLYAAQLLLDSDNPGTAWATWVGGGASAYSTTLSQQGVQGERSKFLTAFCYANWADIPDGATITRLDVQIHGMNQSPNAIDVSVAWTNNGHFNGVLTNAQQVGGGGGSPAPGAGTQVLSFTITEAQLAARGVTRDTLREVKQGSGFMLSIVAQVASSNQAPAGNNLVISQVRTQVQYRTASGGSGTSGGPLLFISE